MGCSPGLWTDLVPARCLRLGALSLWTLGLGESLGLDLGGRRTLGLRTLPLWPLDHDRLWLGMGPRPDRALPLLRPGARSIRRHAALRPRDFDRRQRLVPARSTRAVLSDLPQHAVARSSAGRIRSAGGRDHH